MRFLWVDENNDADYIRGAREGFTGYFFSLQDPRVTKTYLEAQKWLTAHIGVYAAWNWPEFDPLTPEQQGDLLAQKVKAISWLPTTGPKVQWNDERHEIDKCIRVLERFRQHQPKRDLSWTLEGHKGGLFTPAHVQRLLALKVRIVPQLYNGPMTQVWDSLAIARDLTKRGIPDALISPFYDAKSLPYWWDGFAFTQGRLPA